MFSLFYKNILIFQIRLNDKAAIKIFKKKEFNFKSTKF